jgi:protein-tyrosine phosphatase
VALCQAAAADGTETIVATPHVLRDTWVNEDPEAREALIRKLNDLLGGKLTILAGCEYYFSADAVELIERGRWGPLTGLNRSRYLLLEFPPTEIPSTAKAVFHELALMEVTPVVAHPERSHFFAGDPDGLEALVTLGAVAQVTAGSLLGDFGEGPQRACNEFFRRRLVQVVASDAHSLDRRPPRLAAARERVRSTLGKETEVGIFDLNARALLRSETLPWPGTMRLRVSRG